ncbi:hypothetical protein GCM10027068_14000 [Prescottella soli]
MSATTASANSATDSPPARPVPLDQRVDHPEYQPARERRVDPRPEVAFLGGGHHQITDEGIEFPSAREGTPFDGRVPTNPEKQCHIGKLGHEHLDASPHEVLESIDGPTAGHLIFGRDREERVEGPGQREFQELRLAGYVVIDRRLRDAEPLGKRLHAGAVVPLVVEHLHRNGKQRVEIVSRSPGRPRSSDWTCRRHLARSFQDVDTPPQNVRLDISLPKVR